jgi:hypothetical protein
MWNHERPVTTVVRQVVAKGARVVEEFGLDVREHLFDHIGSGDGRSLDKDTCGVLPMRGELLEDIQSDGRVLYFDLLGDKIIVDKAAEVSAKANSKTHR